MPSSNYVDADGRRWEGAPRIHARRACFATYGRVCWLCGHGGAQEVDHLQPPSLGGSMFDVENLRPIHNVTHGCPSCGRKCNRDKGDTPLAQVQRLVTSQDWYAR